MIFMQACPAERLAVGDSYCYNLASQNKRVVIRVTGRKEKESWVALSAGVEESGSLDKAHFAVLSYGRNRTVTSFKEGTQELLSKPLPLPGLDKEMLISTASDYIFKRTKQPARAAAIKSVKGYNGAVKIKSARYEESQDYIDVGTDANLGLVYVAFTQSGEVNGLELVEIKHKK